MGHPIRKKEGFEAEKLFVLPEYIEQDLLQSPLVRPLYITDIGFFPEARFHYRERPEGMDAYIVICCSQGAG